MATVDIDKVIDCLKKDLSTLPGGEDGSDDYEKGYNEGWRAATAHIAFILEMQKGGAASDEGVQQGVE